MSIEKFGRYEELEANPAQSKLSKNRDKGNALGEEVDAKRNTGDREKESTREIDGKKRNEEMTSLQKREAHENQAVRGSAMEGMKTWPDDLWPPVSFDDSDPWNKSHVGSTEWGGSHNHRAG